MAIQDSQEFESYVPVYDAIPEKWEEAQEFLVERLKELANAVNIREIGWYIDEELLSGKAFIPIALPPGDPTPQQFRSILRKVIDIGPLANIGLNQKPHGINVDSNFTLTHLYACATSPTLLTSFEIDHAEPGNEVWMYMDATYINIICVTDRHLYTRCFAIVEYIQEI